jgi:hypothetical protein
MELVFESIFRVRQVGYWFFKTGCCAEAKFRFGSQPSNQTIRCPLKSSSILSSTNLDSLLSGSRSTWASLHYLSFFCSTVSKLRRCVLPQLAEFQDAFVPPPVLYYLLRVTIWRTIPPYASVSDPTLRARTHRADSDERTFDADNSYSIAPRAFSGCLCVEQYHFPDHGRLPPAAYV